MKMKLTATFDGHKPGATITVTPSEARYLTDRLLGNPVEETPAAPIPTKEAKPSTKPEEASK